MSEWVRKRERESSQQDVRRLFIYRASTHRHAWSHARVHGTPIRAHLRRYAWKRAERTESTRTCPRFPWEWTKSSFRAAVYFVLCLFVNGNTAFIVCRNNTMKVAREWLGEINFGKERFNPLKFEFKKFRKVIYRDRISLVRSNRFVVKNLTFFEEILTKSNKS